MLERSEYKNPAVSAVPKPGIALPPLFKADPIPLGPTLAAVRAAVVPAGGVPAVGAGVTGTDGLMGVYRFVEYMQLNHDLEPVAVDGRLNPFYLDLMIV